MNGLNGAEPSHETDISEIFLCLLRFESACELHQLRAVSRPVAHFADALVMTSTTAGISIGRAKAKTRPGIETTTNPPRSLRLDCCVSGSFPNDAHGTQQHHR